METHRNDFAVYRNNPALTYLDYAATTFIPDTVIRAWNDYSQNVGVSINRGDGPLSERAESTYLESKSSILKFFSAAEQYDIIWGKNATECLNLMAYIIGKRLRPGDIVLMGPYEHHSNILPWKYVAQQTGACLVQLPLLESKHIDYEFVNHLDLNRIKIISVSLVSNINAAIIDVFWLKQFIQNSRAFSIVDVSQAAGHKTLKFNLISADAYVMSAHKMYGPKNIGAAIVKKDKIEKMSPFFRGGGMVWDSLGENPKWFDGSRKFEAGTIDVGVIKAWSAACEYLSSIGMDRVEKSDATIWNCVMNHIDGNTIRMVSGGEKDSSICSFSVKGKHPHDISDFMSKHMVELRTGHMCAQDAINNLGETSLCRISWGIGSSEKDIETFFELLEGVI